MITSGGIMENNQPTETTARQEIDPMLLERHMKKMREEQSLGKGIGGGLLAAAAGALIWAAVTVITEYQIGWMAIGIGFLVGYAVRFFGRGVDIIFGVAGALLALAGCLGGNLATVIYFASQTRNVPILDILPALKPEVLLSIMKETFDIMDLVFYGIAAYEGYRFSIAGPSEEDTEKMLRQSS